MLILSETITTSLHVFQVTSAFIKRLSKNNASDRLTQRSDYVNNDSENYNEGHRRLNQEDEKDISSKVLLQRTAALQNDMGGLIGLSRGSKYNVKEDAQYQLLRTQLEACYR